MNKARAIPWVEVYKEISNQLDIFFSEYQENSGPQLYRLCVSDQEFYEENRWVHKFKNSWDVESLDPLHVFASCSGSSLGEETRTKRINVILRILSSRNNKSERTKLFFENIDFRGCPAPLQIQLVTARTIEDQRELWKVFDEVYNFGSDGLAENIFDKAMSWYGVSIGIFTIFLFWVRPNSFLPLDKYTLSFLKEQGKLEKLPKTVEIYNNLLVGETDVYRIVTLLAYSPEEYSNLDQSEKDIYSEYIGTNPENEIRISDSYKGFRLIAIRPKADCDPKYSKSLELETLYSFYSAFSENSETIRFDPDFDKSLFDLDETKLSVTAIVGMNGTGKSTILELFMLAINNIAARKFHFNTSENSLLWAPNLEVEFFFYTDRLYKADLSRDSVLFIAYTTDTQENSHYYPDYSLDESEIDLEDFFYSLTVNYSLHGLNSIYMGDWLNQLFHKNDAYQTPLVIEPFRENGVINVNTQDALVKQRLLSNLLEQEVEDEGGEDLSLRYLKKNVKATGLTLIPNPDKVALVYESTNDEEIIEYKDLIDQIPEILRHIFFTFFVDEAPALTSLELSKSDLNDLCKRYIIKKLVGISVTYKKYQQFFNVKNKEFDEVELFAQLLYEDKSHITFKLRQAINFLKYKIYHGTSEFEFNIELLSNAIADVRLKNIGESIEFLLPPSFFNFEIYLNEDKNISFEKLSSGEKQKIYSINSILYHLRNLDSVQDDEGEHIQYTRINVFLDEIELCFHPELQRTFVMDLHTAINRRPFARINAINICFVTHSPFVLSDIPASNILFLEPHNKSVQTLPSSRELRTFAGNIHELLNDGFFMNSSIGSYSEKVIGEILDFHNYVKTTNDLDYTRMLYEKQKEKFDFIRGSIADKYIDSVIDNHIVDIEELLYPDEVVKKEIQRLEQKITDLRTRVGDD